MVIPEVPLEGQFEEKVNRKAEKSVKATEPRTPLRLQVARGATAEHSVHRHTLAFFLSENRGSGKSDNSVFRASGL